MTPTELEKAAKEAGGSAVSPTDYIDPETGEVIPDDEWEDLSPEVFKFERIGDTISGTYRGAEIVTIQAEETTRHDINTPDGPRFFFGSTTLDGSLRPIDVGDVIRVTFSGLTQKKYAGGNAAKLFKVMRRRRAQPFR